MGTPQRLVTPPIERLLFVCTGNICRSPYLELRMRSAFAAAGRRDIAVASAGTGAVIGHGVSDRLAQRLRERGIDPSTHRGSQLTAAHVESATLILTAEREHRRIITQIDPRSADRAFTLQQFLRLLSVQPGAGESLSELVATANDARGRAGASTKDDDIEDPWRRSRWVYARVATVMDEAVVRLADRLMP